MRIWDIDPGYLNNYTLNEEHREIHRAATNYINPRSHFINHPEAKRWKYHSWAITKRHDLLVAEMELRRIKHTTALHFEKNPQIWPEIYLESPSEQFDSLEYKYRSKPEGRIHLPYTTQQLWAHHKYSVMARSPELCRDFEKKIALLKGKEGFEVYAKQFVDILRIPPKFGTALNVIHQMWEPVAKLHNKLPPAPEEAFELLKAIQVLALKHDIHHLITSTALVELQVQLAASV